MGGRIRCSVVSSSEAKGEPSLSILVILRYLCFIIIMILVSKPVTEEYIIRTVFGHGLNKANVTYDPATFNYMRPGKIYYFKR